MMSRILVSPNLVFEASRSSLNEPKTIGPAAPPPGTPQGDDALGSPVTIAQSSRLLAHLTNKGSVVIAPVVTRRWSSEWWCNAAGCPQTTWVERLLLLRGATSTAPHSRSGDGSDSGTPAPPMPVGSPQDLPTSSLAVRTLGLTTHSVDIAVVETATGAYDFVPRTSPSQPSLCPPHAVYVPVIAFSAEIVSMLDGRLLARFDEARTPSISPPAPVSVGRQRFCDNAFAAYRAVSDKVVTEMYQHVATTTDEIFQHTLDLLY
jgi:hypothetical protein